MLSIKEINLLQAQNEQLKKQNRDLQTELSELKIKYELLEQGEIKNDWCRSNRNNPSVCKGIKKDRTTGKDNQSINRRLK